MCIRDSSTTTEAEASEWRASIFKNPMTGDGNQGYKSVSPESETQAYCRWPLNKAPALLHFRLWHKDC